MEKTIPKDGLLDTGGEQSNDKRHQVEIHQLIEKLIDCTESQKKKVLQVLMGMKTAPGISK